MNTLKKLGLLLLILLLVFQTAFLPGTITSASTSELLTAQINSVDEDAKIPVFQENSEQSEVLFSLSNGDTVIVIEQMEDFSLVEFENPDDSELTEGFVYTENLLISDQDEISDGDLPSGDDSSDLDDSTSDENSNEEATDEEKNSDSQSGTDNNEGSTDLSPADEKELSELPPLEEEDSLDGLTQEKPTSDSSLETDKDETTSSKQEKEEPVKEQPEMRAKAFSMQSSISTIQSALNSGVALMNPTHVYSSRSTKSQSLKSYSQGSTLLYREDSGNWYVTNVWVNGEQKQGYIAKSHVETSTKNQELLSGIALKKPTSVYQTAATSSRALKTYADGSILQYRTFSDNWYVANVWVNGNKQTGYIHSSHVENTQSGKDILQGIGLNSPTRVYSRASTESSAHKTYPEGTLLQYRSFSNDWYIANVWVNGDKKTGYIRKTHVENATPGNDILLGIASYQNTAVHSSTSTGSSVLKSYRQGSLLQYRSFSKDWYTANVWVNGKKRTGYIHKNHVENATPGKTILLGVASNKNTAVYSSTSTGSSVLKSYRQGSLLQYRSFSKDWYTANVWVNGEKKTGYIHKNHVENATSNPESLSGVALNSTTSVFATPSTGSKALKSYSRGTILKFRTFTTNWYEADVWVDGVKKTGYIAKSHVSLDRTETVENYSNYNITLKQAVEMQKKASPQTDKYRNSPAYIRSSDLDIVDGGSITGSSVRLRTTAKLNTNSNIKVTVGNGTPVIILDDNVKGDSYSGSTKWYKIKYGEDILYVHSSLANKNSKIGVAKGNINIRSSKSTSSHVFGTLSKDSTIAVLEQGSTWHRVSYGTWRNPTASDLEYYLDPQNFVRDNKQQFQFLDLSKSSGLSVTVLNRYLSGKGVLNNQGQAFMNAGKANGISDLYLISHALLETGNGSSTLAKGVKYNGVTVYNVYGIGAYDSCPLDCGAKRAYEEGWTTPAKAITGGARFIGNGYINDGQNTLYKMRWNPDAMDRLGYASHQYATDIGWAYKQINTMYNLYQELDSYVLQLDIPSYK